MNTELIQHLTVPPSRLASGRWEGDRETGEGDIDTSYSADLIAVAGKVRTVERVIDGAATGEVAQPVQHKR